MLTGYFDESQDAKYLVLAGYIAPARSWVRFEREWRKVLAEFGIDYFHMKDYAHSRRSFEGWPESRRVALMNLLAFVIQSRVEWPISIVLSLDDYYAVVPPGFQQQVYDPYFLCLWSCILMAFRCYRGEQLSGRALHFIFDDKSGFNTRAQKIIQSCRNLPSFTTEQKQFLGPLTFADDKQLNPLQAADLFAYEVRKKYGGYSRKSLDAIDKHGVHMYLGRNSLKGIIDDVKQDMERKREAEGLGNVLE